MQVQTIKLDGILFLSFISGRNAEMLIGKQVVTAPILKQIFIWKSYQRDIYLLIVEIVHQFLAQVILHLFLLDDDTLAACTAMAGEMLGLKLIFMDGGSGAKNPISEQMIRSVRKSIDAPLIIGGGIMLW